MKLRVQHGALHASLPGRRLARTQRHARLLDDRRQGRGAELVAFSEHHLVVHFVPARGSVEVRK